MLSNHLNQLILSKLGHSPTKGQRDAITGLSEFVSLESDRTLVLIRGYAGTGKTTLISAYVKALAELKQSCVLLAPTGRAAKVLSQYTASPALTIHKKIYRQRSAGDGFGTFDLDRNQHSNTFFMVDEASMISDTAPDSSIFGSGRLLEDLMTYVKSGTNCKLIITGDTAQLPPIGLPLSPALSRTYLEGTGFKVLEFLLQEVVRQTHDSGILFNATRIREAIDAGTNNPVFRTESFPDVVRLTGDQLIEEISKAYDKFGQDEVIVVNRSNKRANGYNMGIRREILWREEELCRGDMIMIVRNNYHWLPDDKSLDFIANGDIARIEAISQFEEQYGFRFANVRLTLPDYNDVCIDAKIMLDTLLIESPALPYERNKELYYKVSEDYSEIKDKRKRLKKVREDAWFAALQIKYAYAVTCHKAQGGQWKAVFVDQGYVSKEMKTSEYYRWLYTAFTRATENLYLVGFPDEDFE